MAVIGKIRKRSGLLIAFIGVAMAAFVLGDFFKGSNNVDIDPVAVMNGTPVSYQTFESKVQKAVENYKVSTQNSNVDPQTYDQIRQEVWKEFLNEHIFNKEYNKIGMDVSEDELFDMVQGKFIHPQIQQTFVDQNTGQFNREYVINYLASLEDNPNDMQRWNMFLNAIKQERAEQKYINLLKEGMYCTSKEASNIYSFENKKLSATYFVQPYYSIDDSTVTVSESDINEYYNYHKEKYESKIETRSFDYVVFEVSPSIEDKRNIEEWVNVIYQKVKDIETDKKLIDFVNQESDNQFVDKWTKKEELNKNIDSALFNSPIGYTTEPYFENSSYSVARLMDKSFRPDSINAKHILISHKLSPKGNPEIKRTKEEAELLVDSLIKVLKSEPEKFELLAMQYSDGPSKDKGGDLGWFNDGMMVPEFNEACVKGKVGEITKAETVFGIHIIKVEDKTKDIEKVKLAVVSRELTPTKKTYDVMYTEASRFAGENNNPESFKNTVIEKGLNKRVATDVPADRKYLPGVESPRQIIKWAYDNNTEIGNVSKVFEMDNKYIVAILTEIKEAGYTPLADVKDEIERTLKIDKKAELISNKLTEEISKNSNLISLSNSLGLTVDSITNLSFSDENIPRQGREMEVIGKLFSLEKNVISGPIKGKKGIYVAVVNSLNTAPEMDNYSAIQEQKATRIKGEVAYKIKEAIEKVSDIEDNRPKYY